MFPNKEKDNYIYIYIYILSGFSFTNIDELQDCSGRGRAFL